MKRINCVGMACPMPVINTKKYFDSIDSGIAEVIVDNEVAKNNIFKYATGCGYIAKVREEDKNYIINIEKKENIKEEKNEEDFVIVVTSDKFGEGNDELGTLLMKGYIYTLSENDNIPKELIFLNGGVKLTVKNSAVLESLQNLEKRGVKILSCGTCLDFYGIKEELAIGEISNMYTIVESMNNAKKVIKL
ncbi:sulfurtransferase-like selenium metabolism protein YedF [Clostridium sp.]|uniref:sulfurtransferase-like selenium metabolism protein YedF n=1 Tax=Clostridium sp. TaxID=1506 RepID=UPI00262323B4|nr:sulfurtransferase-like selenium metabolism protein YedF [Clostridium sp.]